MNDSLLVREQLDALARHLSARRDIILQQWHSAAEADPELTTLDVLSRSQFHDHVPGILDAFNERLRSRTEADREEAKADELENAAGHGLHRWQQGYRQREVMIEWRHLHLCLVDELEDYATRTQGLHPKLMPGARRALAELCGEGVCESAAQYWQLQQVEATERLHQLEKALAELKTLERQRAEVLREAAHDLRGNLGIVTNAAAVLTHAEADGKRGNVANILQRGVHSLHTLLDDLMSLARLEAGHEKRTVEEFDAAAVLSELCANLQASASRQALFLDTRGPLTLQVQGDAVKVRRIAQNLLLNALAHTKRGGIKVSWEIVKGGSIPRWLLCIQDTGPGFTGGMLTPIAQVLKAATDEIHGAERDPDTGSIGRPAPMMEAQSQPVRAPRPGEGIGLSIVKRLCDLLNANIELETETSKGSTFRITFPLYYDAQPSEPAPLTE